MNFLNFKQQYELWQYKASEQAVTPDLNILHHTQYAFDSLFHELRERKTQRIPIWLFRLYDKFVRMVENYHFSYSKSTKDFAELLEEIKFAVSNHLGEDVAQRLVVSRITNVKKN